MLKEQESVIDRNDFRDEKAIYSSMIRQKEIHRCPIKVSDNICSVLFEGLNFIQVSRAKVFNSPVLLASFFSPARTDIHASVIEVIFLFGREKFDGTKGSVNLNTSSSKDKITSACLLISLSDRLLSIIILSNPSFFIWIGSGSDLHTPELGPDLVAGGNSRFHSSKQSLAHHQISKMFITGQIQG